MWEGIDYIERRLNTVMNRLSYVIVPGGDGPLPKSKQIEYVEEAIKTRAWLAAMKPPRSVKRWAERQLAALDGRITRASAKIANG
jgi:hypothetical protein